MLKVGIIICLYKIYMKDICFANTIVTNCIWQTPWWSLNYTICLLQNSMVLILDVNLNIKRNTIKVAILSTAARNFKLFSKRFYFLHTCANVFWAIIWLPWRTVLGTHNLENFRIPRWKRKIGMIIYLALGKLTKVWAKMDHYHNK